MWDEITKSKSKKFTIKSQSRLVKLSVVGVLFFKS